MEIVVARLLRAHGLAGEVFAGLSTSDPEALFTVGRTFRVVGERPEGVPAELVLETARPHGGGWLLRFAGRPDRESVGPLRGLEIAVPGEDLRPLEEDEFFLQELAGMEAWQTGGGRIGAVLDVYDAGGHVLLGVESEGRERLVPFRREIVTRVDREAGKVWIDPPAGLLDL